MFITIVSWEHPAKGGNNIEWWSILIVEICKYYVKYTLYANFVVISYHYRSSLTNVYPRLGLIIY